jgi:hypothetical protein
MDEIATQRPGRCAMTDALLRRAQLLLLRRCGHDAAMRPVWVLALEDRRLGAATTTVPPLRPVRPAEPRSRGNRPDRQSRGFRTRP